MLLLLLLAGKFKIGRASSPSLTCTSAGTAMHARGISAAQTLEPHTYWLVSRDWGVLQPSALHWSAPRQSQQHTQSDN
jgi:hypothetical protein